MEAILTSFLGSIPLRNEVLTIGRAPRNGLFINNATVSRRHAEIHPTTQGYFCIIDLESTSGTFVNGVRLAVLTPYLLRAGDAIQVGNFSLLYEEREMPLSADELATLPIAGSMLPDQSLPGTPASGVDQRSAYGDVLVVSDIQSLSPVSDERLSALPSTDARQSERASVTASADEVPEVLSATLKLVPGEGLPDTQTEPVPLQTTASEEKANVLPRPPSLNLTQQALRFTAFYPQTVSVDNWQTLLVYAHIEKALEEVRVDARRLRERLEAVSFATDAGVEQPLLAEGLQITVQPVFQGVTFQPERISFSWTDELHPAAFRFSVDARWAGAVGTGEVLLLAGPLIIAALRIPLRFVTSDAPLEAELEEISVSRYTRIFTSYSHDDTAMI